MVKLKISFDDKYFKSDEIVHGRVARKFLEKLIANVFNKANRYWQAHKDLTGHSELPLKHNERNLYSIFASAIDKITPVHLSEWSFNKTYTGDDTRRVDFWCLNKNKGSENGKAINYFIEIKKNYYCLSKGTEKKFTFAAEQNITQITEQIKELKKICPKWEWDGDGAVYIGIIVTHAYHSAEKTSEYDETQIRENIHNLLDGRSGAQLLFATWNLPDDMTVQWENDDRCKFISIACIVISKSR